MKCSSFDQERDGLRTIQRRWDRRGWRFTPLDRLDGINDTSEAIDSLRSSHVCWPELSKEFSVPEAETLLDELEDLFAHAMRPWDELKTVFECRASQRDFYRWPAGMYPAGIRREAQYRFHELRTTSRFSVDEVPNIAALQEVNPPHSGVTLRHVVALAAMVCIVEAIEAMEQIEGAFSDAEMRDQCINSMREAVEAKSCAGLWASHLETMNFEIDQYKRIAKTERAKQSAKARKAATANRRASVLTVEEVAECFNKRGGEKWESVCSDLADRWGVSESTVARRLREAKKRNLVS